MKGGRAYPANMEPAEETLGQNIIQITLMRLVTQSINLKDAVHQLF